MVENKNAYKILVGKPVVKRPLGSPRIMCVMNNTKMDLREMWWMIWAGSIWLRIGTSGGLL
jgi:hypothetical protein